MKIIQNLNCSAKSILLIVDYNVNILNGQISSSFKIDCTIETINHIKSQEPLILFILTHLGRPTSRDSCSVEPIHQYLSLILPGIEYMPIDKFDAKSGLFFGDNSRYYSSDELNEFYSHFDVIVNDAFGKAHRPMNCKCYAGLLMQKEVEILRKLKSVDMVIMGGAKDKSKVINRFNSRVFIGGLLGIQLMKGLGYQVGKTEKAIEGKELETRIKLEGENQIFLPLDFIVKTADDKIEKRSMDKVQENDTIIDIGEESINLIEQLVLKANLILWNGPLGKFEDKNAPSTEKLVKILERVGEKVVIGGGESSMAVQKYSSIDKFHHVSTGGGAMLNYLTGSEMPGLESVEY